MSTSALEASFARAQRDYESRDDDRAVICAGCSAADAAPESGLCDECGERATEALDHELACRCEECRWLSVTMDRTMGVLS